jgi:hypothetical protein
MTTWFDLGDDDERAVGEFMSRLVALPTPETLSDPRLLWWKAQLLQRWDAERRALAPLDVMERVEIVAGLAAAVVLLVWAAPTVVRLLTGPLRQFLG